MRRAIDRTGTAKLFTCGRVRWCTCTCICTCNCPCQQQQKIVHGSCNRASWLRHVYNLSGIRLVVTTTRRSISRMKKVEERDGPNGRQQTLQQVSFQKNTPVSALNANAYMCASNKAVPVTFQMARWCTGIIVAQCTSNRKKCACASMHIYIYHACMGKQCITRAYIRQVVYLMVQPQSKRRSTSGDRIFHLGWHSITYVKYPD